MKQENMIVFVTDEHARRFSGCYGDPIAKTPHIDALAESGTKFNRAYTPSPICVPARASLATGKWVHQTGNWGSVQAYDGTPDSWAHKVRQAGHKVVSFGKLGFRQTGEDHGFDQEFLPINNLNGVGWLAGLLRDPLPVHLGDFETRPFAEHIGVGETDYTKYDRHVTATACSWLRENGQSNDKPWIMYVSLISPHYPLIAPQEFYDLYSDEQMELPASLHEDPDHPILKELYAYFNYKDYMTPELAIKARRAYYGLCSFADHLLGEVMETLKTCGLDSNTRVVYTSDHGEMLGNKGMWTKMVMHEDSVGIPLLMSGPDIPEGKSIETPVSLVDIYPTVLSNLGVGCDDPDIDGHDLFRIADGEVPKRHIISEYHDGGCPTGIIMLINGPWKYIHYAGSVPQLFNIEEDGNEDHDLAGNPSYSDVLKMCDDALRALLDPDDVNRRAFEDQAAVIEELGGQDAILNQEQSQIFIEVGALYDNADELRTPLDVNVRRSRMVC